MQYPVKKPCALFWDESYLWGLMAYRALCEAGLPFELAMARDIRAGNLDRYAMIYVPGGWAAAKVRALGKRGQSLIRRFVEDGGSYLGICGGAGLATDSHLGLLPVYRTPNAHRVPSFSGPISLALNGHPIWEDISTPVFSAWWPPQLSEAEDSGFRVLARYGEARPDAMSADIRVEDGCRAGWAGLEKQYGIFLNPERLKGKPAVVEGAYGGGKVILSLVHFDTPGDCNGALVLKNLWRYLGEGVNPDGPACDVSGPAGTFIVDNPASATLLGDIRSAVHQLIAKGEHDGLWHRRNDLLLQWRRGVRGMEFSTLDAMTREIATRLVGNPTGDASGKPYVDPHDPTQLKHDLEAIKGLLLPFVDDATALLRLERARLEDESVPLENSPDKKIGRLRQNLFGPARHFGGRFKPLIDAVDRLLYELLKPM